METSYRGGEDYKRCSRGPDWPNRVRFFANLTCQYKFRAGKQKNTTQKHFLGRKKGPFFWVFTNFRKWGLLAQVTPIFGNSWSCCCYWCRACSNGSKRDHQHVDGMNHLCNYNRCYKKAPWTQLRWFSMKTHLNTSMEDSSPSTMMRPRLHLLIDNVCFYVYFSSLKYSHSRVFQCTWYTFRAKHLIFPIHRLPTLDQRRVEDWLIRVM